MFRAHFNYDQPNKGELSFRKGDVFRVVDTLHNGVVGSWQVFRIGEFTYLSMCLYKKYNKCMALKTGGEFYMNLRSHPSNQRLKLQIMSSCIVIHLCLSCLSLRL
jgi:hypothetical protein